MIKPKNICSVLGLLIAMAAGDWVHAGTITIAIDSAEPVLKAVAIQRQRTMGGMYSKPVTGKLTPPEAEGPAVPKGIQKYVFEVPEGRFDLALTTERGIFEGWDTALPRSDYEEEQPLSDESRQAILTKMGTETISGFSDEAWVIDLRGNIQHAAALLYQLRTQSWTESVGENDRQWIYRVDRWEWESPDDDTWTTNKEVPYYALHRERIEKGGDKSLKITFASHLGGIVLTKENPNRDLGVVKLPQITPGIHAINPDGSLIQPIKVKPKNGAATNLKKSNTEAPTTQESQEAEAKAKAKNKSANKTKPPKAATTP